MSENGEISETSSDTQLLAEYKDGKLQIVEVTPFHKGGDGQITEPTDMPSLEVDAGTTKYVQVVNTDKSVMQLDLLNLTLVRCEDGSESYRLVSSADVAGDGSADGTVTCVSVLHSSDNEEVVLPDVDHENTYVMMEGGDPLVLYQAHSQEQEEEHQEEHDVQVERESSQVQKSEPPKLTPIEILEKVKALQKSKSQLIRSQPQQPRSTRGRKRKSELPPPHELLSSPNFKLYLYSCKFCSFKCNAIKEMTAHKAEVHSGGRGGKWRDARAHSPALQCSLCPYRGVVHSQLMKHVQDIHGGETERNSNKVDLDTPEVEAADVLVCGACGYESASRGAFRRHVEAVHGATASCTIR